MYNPKLSLSPPTNNILGGLPKPVLYVYMNKIKVLSTVQDDDDDKPTFHVMKPISSIQNTVVPLILFNVSDDEYSESETPIPFYWKNRAIKAEKQIVEAEKQMAEYEQGLADIRKAIKNRCAYLQYKKYTLSPEENKKYTLMGKNINKIRKNKINKDKIKGNK